MPRFKVSATQYLSRRIYTFVEAESKEAAIEKVMEFHDEDQVQFLDRETEVESAVEWDAEAVECIDGIDN